MSINAILKLMGLQPARANPSRTKHRVQQYEDWGLIGYVRLYDTTVKDLAKVPQWLQEEWSKVRGTSRTLGGKWKIVEDVENPDPCPLSEGYGCTGYYRNGKKFRYGVVEWDGIMGAAGWQFYRKPRRSK